MRVIVHPPGGVRDAHRFEQLDGAAARLPAPGEAVHGQRFLDLAADGEDRVEGGHRLLEDEADAGAADPAHAALIEREQVLAVERSRCRTGSGRAGSRAGGSRAR